MPDVTEILSAFCSLGDNCEFGFVQRKFGVEPGDLLRWALASPKAVAAGLKDRFRGIYIYDQLVASADDMVHDKSYDIQFHSKLRSERVEGGRRYIAPESERHAIHRDELPKIQHLARKLLEQLESADKIFVYKRNSRVTDGEIDELREQLRAYNPRNLLLLVGTHDKLPGSVWLSGTGLLMASIDRLAPYDHADDVSYNIWLEICEKAYALAHA
jgi:hypothetical protein